jgi:hypothetical protein
MVGAVVIGVGVAVAVAVRDGGEDFSFPASVFFSFLFSSLGGPFGADSEGQWEE